MKAANYRVLITTSGLGQKLGYLTEYTNKALVRIGKKPAISYILENYPNDTEFVITLGHFGNQVKAFLNLVYPEKKITFVKVDNYEGRGSGLGYSMLQARHYLQLPFIYQASDTLVHEKAPPPIDNNWIGGFRGANSADYASFNVAKNRVTNINEKGALNYDFLHIGLIGVKDYKEYWDSLFQLYKSKANSSMVNDSDVMNMMLGKNIPFEIREFKTWQDIGNVDGLNKAREASVDKFQILDKRDESIFLFDKFVVKFYADETKVKAKLKRAKLLSPLTPKILGSRKNFYKYRYCDGDLYSKVATPTDFQKFLEWSEKKLWKKRTIVENGNFKKAVYKFYHDKTIQRVDKFLEMNSIKDTDDIINGQSIPSIKKIIEQIDFDWLCAGDQRLIHGDYILENILKTGAKYILLDWREDFGGLYRSGDIYYDLAKLNHNLTVNHDIVYNNLYSVSNYDGQIECEIYRKQNLVLCQEVLFKFIADRGYDLEKVKLLSSIIWLNMSPLHHYPFNKFLFYFGKYNIWRYLKEKNRN